MITFDERASGKQGGNGGKKVRIKVTTDGVVTARMEGIQGEACAIDMAALDGIGETIRSENTPDFYAAGDDGNGALVSA